MCAYAYRAPEFYILGGLWALLGRAARAAHHFGGGQTSTHDFDRA